MSVLINTEEEDNPQNSKDLNFPTSTKALIIFTRNPELGKCKTRLARTVGDENALKVYKKLVEHTAQITRKLNIDKFVYYSDGIHLQDSWDDSIYTKRIQKGADLGERMYNAFSLLFSSGYKEVIVIGSDLYNLSEHDLAEAYERLSKNNYVIGPATDGGYYLLGMKILKKDLFENKEWSSESVLQDTLKNLDGEQYTLLEERNDIDYYEDLQGIEELENLIEKQESKESGTSHS